MGTHGEDLFLSVYAALAQLDRVFGYEPKGRGFESLTPCQKNSSDSFRVYFFTYSLLTLHFSLSTRNFFGK